MRKFRLVLAGPLATFSLVAALGAALTGCGPAAVASSGRGSILAVGAENEYANVISQVGGRYVRVGAIMDNPNTDPHAFEASPSVASVISSARLVVQNGLGYDGFMQRIESASRNPKRQVIDVQHLLGVPNSEPNPHLWYSPRTMPAVAGAVARALAHLAPAHAGYFEANARRFDLALQPWYRAVAAFRRRYGGAAVATTEPVADYMLQGAGARILTPLSLQLAIMNGVDPAPQNVSAQDALFTGHRVKAFLYNRQVTDSITQSFLRLAEARHIPVVGVYETLPPGFTYQGWMLAETRAVQAAVASGRSTQTL
ncbi:MAG TPA: zinc ABC transporter substrate-binding protein [Solirubrobacteraceae bacterium]|jgi:zinc/manganese transport system substrate-binding protein|nr:zinc ABC transporter substrate-binding protein [Solirubrobacteraceae bacterium]